MADVLTIGGVVMPMVGVLAVLCALAHRAGRSDGYTRGYAVGRQDGVNSVLDGMAARSPGLRDQVARALAAGKDPTEIPTDRGDQTQ